MSEYDQLLSRSGVASKFLPEKVALGLIDEIATKDSAVMQRFRRIQMSTKQERFPVLASFPTAYWVNGDTGLKKTTTMAWEDKYINAEELAVIVPVPDTVAADAQYDVWDNMLPYLREAIARAFDDAVLFGTNAPASFPEAVVPAAIAAGNTYERGQASPEEGGVAEDINQLMATVEADGYTVTGFIAPMAFRSRVRSARDTTGQALADMAGGTLWGLPISYTGLEGLWPTGEGEAELIAGQWNRFVVGIRQDIQIKIFTEGVITDNSNAVVYNLMQQDMKAIRVTFRAGWQVSNPINHSEETEADRYPAGVLVTPAG